jgi:hypothetical protein
VDETFRMLGREHEADLEREARNRRLAASARGGQSMSMRHVSDPPTATPIRSRGLAMCPVWRSHIWARAEGFADSVEECGGGHRQCISPTVLIHPFDTRKNLGHGSFQHLSFMPISSDGDEARFVAVMSRRHCLPLALREAAD